MRQGRLKVATWVMVNGRLASGFCSPALTCARAAVDASSQEQSRTQKRFHVFLSHDVHASSVCQRAATLPAGELGHARGGTAVTTTVVDATRVRDSNGEGSGD